MERAPRPVNQHWIPRFYLRRFATPNTGRSRNPKAWIFSKHHGGGDPMLTNIRNVCARRYLYSPRQGDGHRDWKLELKLGDLESTLARIWPVASADFLDLADPSTRKALALFIAITWLRHPDNLALVARLHGDLVGIFEEAPRDAAGNPHVVVIAKGGEHLIDASAWDQYRQWDDDDHHRFFAEQIEREAIHLAELLLSKRWSAVFAARALFITSDKPVAKMHQSRETFGFGTHGTIVTFPLSPTRVLLMDDNHAEPANQYYPLHADDPAALNYTTMRNAANFIISPRPTDEVLREIVQHADAWERENDAAQSTPSPA